MILHTEVPMETNAHFFGRLLVKRQGKRSFTTLASQTILLITVQITQNFWSMTHGQSITDMHC
jgi:hypothetical protein